MDDGLPDKQMILQRTNQEEYTITIHICISTTAQMGFQTESKYRERQVHVNTASNEEKEEFKKEQRWFQIIYLRDLLQYHLMNLSSSLTVLLEKYGYSKIQGLQSESQVHINSHVFLVQSALIEDSYSDSTIIISTKTHSTNS